MNIFHVYKEGQCSPPSHLQLSLMILKVGLLPTVRKTQTRTLLRFLSSVQRLRSIHPYQFNYLGKTCNSLSDARHTHDTWYTYHPPSIHPHPSQPSPTIPEMGSCLSKSAVHDSETPTPTNPRHRPSPHQPTSTPLRGSRVGSPTSAHCRRAPQRPVRPEAKGVVWTF